MTRTEIQVGLNSNEIAILLSALQCVESMEEYHIERAHGSLSTLYNRLNDLSIGMDLSPNQPPEDYVEPSF